MAKNNNTERDRDATEPVSYTHLPAQSDAPQHRYYAEEQHHGEVRHLDEVVQVFVRLDGDPACGIDRPAVGEEQHAEPRYEEKYETDCRGDHPPAGTFVDGLVVDVIHEILAGQRCGEECHLSLIHI